MPKVSATVLASKIIEGQMLSKIRLNGSMPKQGDRITVKWGRTRSNSQNALYWLYLQFLWQDCNLKDEYNTIEELHETLKATFLSKKIFHEGKEFIHVKSTTELDKVAFGEYLKQIDDAMVEYQHLNTAPFWQEYRDNKDGKVSMDLTPEGEKWLKDQEKKS